MAQNKIFDFLKPRKAAGEVRRREQELMAKLEQLMNIGDEATFQEALQREFGITQDHPRYRQITDVWHAAE